MATRQANIDDIELSPDQIYLRNKRIPRVDAEFEWTDKRVAELQKCAKDIKYFSENYFYINTVDDGKVKIDLYPAQKRVLKSLVANRFVIVNASRQIGKTTLMCVYALWVTCFNADKRVVIVANKEKTAINILRRIKMAYEELPNWLKPGADTWGSTEVMFGNDSSIAISTTSSSAARGDTVNCVDGSTIVTIRDSKSNEVFDVPIQVLYEMLEKDGGEMRVCNIQ